MLFIIFLLVGFYFGLSFGMWYLLYQIKKRAYANCTGIKDLIDYINELKNS